MITNVKLDGKGAEKLANGIIIQAAKDYREALKRLKKHPRDTDARGVKDECERFFRSQWYSQLTSVDGEFIIRQLQEEVKK